jgi:hypothetical protein
MAGPAKKLGNEVRNNAIDKAALTLSRNLMFGFRSRRQVAYKPRDEDVGFRVQKVRENPRVMG